MKRLTEKDYRWNFIVNSIDNAFFSVGMTFGSVFTIFPVFAKNLGASNIELGLISAITNLGWGIPAIWGAKYAERSAKKLSLVLKVTMLERVPYLLIALISLYLVSFSTKLALYLSIVTMGVAIFAMGFLGPPWMSMIEKVIDPRRRGTYFAVGSGLGALMGIGGSLIARRLLAEHPFPRNFAYVFLTGFIFFMLSFLFLSLTREVPDERIYDSEPVFDYIKKMKFVFSDKNFRNFLIERIISSFMFSSGGFMTVYLLKKLSLPDDSAAVFTAVVLASQGVSSFLFGPIGDKKGHKLNLMLSKVCYALAILLALVSERVEQAYVVYALMGVVNTTNNVGSMAITLDMTSNKRKELYMGSLYFMTSPFSFVAPLICGKLIDNFGYAVPFFLTGVIGMFNLLYLWKCVEDPRARR
ncbi:MAG: MFS transporter [Pseudothermotoga sp.]|uniref:MFS transporter n=1 Tax=Pseudothermotoga sp. TaxID=2033661 RepID=UPI000E981164|nr:MFS transporter [Pseudothermotoga sp.]HBT38794.1 MFS transporter [Pseudothermotoga sp.]HCO98307.1 MFS transporter [Pseudothermotoga sp.]